MPYAIFRVEKLKTYSQIARSGSHTDRAVDTPNADPELTIKNVDLVPVNGKTTQDLVRERIGDIKHRKDANLCAELFLGASPEFFRPNEPDRAFYYEEEILNPWVETNLQWLKSKYGDNLVRATLHLDESTPHIAAYVVSIHDDPRTGGKKLSYEVDFGGDRYRFQKLQDEYAKAMEPLGLQRGLRGSKAEHQEVKRFYGAIAEANETAISALPIPEPGESAEAYSQRAAVAFQALADQAAIAKVKSMESKRDKATARSIAAEADNLKKDLKEKDRQQQEVVVQHQAQTQQLELSLTETVSQIEQLKAEAENAKAAALLTIAEAVLNDKTINSQNLNPFRAGRYILSRKSGFTQIERVDPAGTICIAHDKGGTARLTEHIQENDFEVFRDLRRRLNQQKDQEFAKAPNLNR